MVLDTWRHRFDGFPSIFKTSGNTTISRGLSYFWVTEGTDAMIGLWVSWLLMVMVVVSLCANGSLKKQFACPMEISSIPESMCQGVL